ncbi:DUF3192 domain-containing protein [Planctomycetota bacterium]
MKKFILVLLLCIGLVGCVSSLEKTRTRNRGNLLKLSVGMTKQQVVEIMGTGSAGGRFGETRVNNPYKSEIIQPGATQYEVLYYYTDLDSVIYSANPSFITDKDLTPLIFDDGILIGWGKEFLKTKQTKN